MFLMCFCMVSGLYTACPQSISQVVRLGQNLRCFELNYVPARCQLVQIVCPLLHHAGTVFQVLGAVVRPAVRVLHGMGQLRFNHQRVYV